MDSSSSSSSAKMRTKLSVRNQTRFKKSAAKKKHMDLSLRENTIFKKAKELSILCDVELCVLYYGRDGNLIKTWPEDQSKVRDMAQRFHNLSENEKSKKSTNLSQFLNKKIKDEMKRCLENNDTTFLEKVLEFKDSLQTKLRKLQINQTEPDQNQNLAASSSSTFFSTDDMSSSVLINDPLMTNLSNLLMDNQSRAASSGFATTHLYPTLISDPCQQQQTQVPLPNYLNNGVYSDSVATDSLNLRQGNFSIVLYNHDNGSFSQLPGSVSRFDQATTPLNTGLLGSQGFGLTSYSNNIELPTVIPPRHMQTQDPLLYFDQFVAPNQTPSFYS